MSTKKNKNQQDFIFINSIYSIAEQKGLKVEEVVEHIKDIFTRVYHKKIDPEAEVQVDVNLQEGYLKMYNLKLVVEDVTDQLTQILWNDPQVKKANLKLNDKFYEEIDYSNFSQTIAQQIKQQLIQKTRESEKQKIYEKYKTKVGDIIFPKVFKIMPNHVILDLNDTTAYLSELEMLEKDRFVVGQNVWVYVVSIKEMAKNSPIIVSRTHPNLVQLLLEKEVEDIKDNVVEIVSIARIASKKTKIAVKSNYPEVDPVGACIGIRGQRINNVMDAINGEKIDILQYSDNIEEYVINSLLPAKIFGIKMMNNNKEATIIVYDDQFQLAVGKGGLNVKLAVKLTKVKIDIKTETWAKQEDFKFKLNTNQEFQKNKTKQSGNWSSDQINIINQLSNHDLDIDDEISMNEFLLQHQDEMQLQPNDQNFNLFDEDSNIEINSNDIEGFINDDGEYTNTIEE